MRRNTTRSASRIRHYIFAKIWYARQRAFLYLKELLSILQTASSCSRYTTFFLFGSRFHRQNLSKPSPLFNADVSENALPLVSQSINNFSDYDISQSHDWECPSLSLHVLLLVYKEILELDRRNICNLFLCAIRSCKFTTSAKFIDKIDEFTYLNYKVENYCVYQSTYCSKYFISK